MPRKRSPIFQKFSNLFQVSIFIAKMKKIRIIKKLIFLKKSSRLKKFKLLQHYDYGYIKEYQFSPSSTPLIHHHKKPFKNRKYRDMHSIFFMCKCLGSLRDERGGYGDYPILEALPAIEDDVVARDLSELLDSGVQEDSVNERAEKFIERFYDEIRIQRQNHCED